MKQAAVIMAGGAGTRLWPLSRRHRPKQLLRIIEGQSLIRRAFDRLRLRFAPEDVYIIALAEHLPAIADELPELPRDNLIGEPMGRDTANAVALSAAILHARDADTVMGVFTADQLIRPAERFAEIVARGYAAVERFPDALVTFGIRPTEPHTGLGYVERGERLDEGVYRVQSFKEKPDPETAKRYVASGNFDWNSGMFVWRTATILEQIRARLPVTHAAVEQIAAAWSGGRGAAVAGDLYPSLEKISIDYAVMERAPEVLVVEMPLDWLDVGSWTALPAVLGKDGAENTYAAPRTVAIDAQKNIFVSEDDHLIAAIGVEDLVVVHSPDATLICRRDQVQRIKELVAQLEREQPGRFG